MHAFYAALYKIVYFFLNASMHAVYKLVFVFLYKSMLSMHPMLPYIKFHIFSYSMYASFAAVYKFCTYFLK